MKILGIDVGDKRIGLAMSEDMLAVEYDTLAIQSFEQAAGKIQEILESEEIMKVVIGLPVTSRGESEQAKKIKEFVSILQGKTRVPVVLEDETLTSFEAEEILKDEGLSVDEAKQRVDQLSAKLILQQYLENTQGEKGEV